MIQEKVILNDIVYRLNPDGKSYNLEECRCRGSSVEIAGTIDRLPVTGMKSYAFSDESLLERISIPPSINEIPQGAFQNCSKLNYVSFYGKKIGYLSFSGCTSLRRIYFPEVEFISEKAFYNCVNLNDIFFPSVREIGDNAFSQCFSLVDANLPESVSKIGAGAFSACRKMTVFTVPRGVDTIRRNTFSACENLADIRLHEGIVSIESFAFRDCKSLRSIELPNSLAKIGESIFLGCDNLIYWGSNIIYSNGGEVLVKCPKEVKSLNIPSGVTQIADGAFEKCDNLTEIIIPDGVKAIGDRAFCGCRALKTVKLPGSIASIGKKAFWNCPQIIRIDIPDIASWCAITFGSEDEPAFYDDLRLYVGGVQLIDLVIPDSVDRINDYAFRNCSSLKSIKVASTGMHIGKRAFESCINLESLIVGPGVECIGERAFNKCTKLTNVIIAESIKKVEESAFKDCKKLSFVSTPSISAWCKIDFADIEANPLNCSEALYIGDEIVTKLVIPDEVDCISEYAFACCQSLKEITISSNLKKIGKEAFCWCENLEKVFITDIKSWCSIAFSEGQSNPLSYAKELYLDGKVVKDVFLPNTVDFINDYAFFGYESLGSIIIGTTVKRIGKFAFGECKGLKIFCEQAEKPDEWDEEWLFLSDDDEYIDYVYWGVSFFDCSNKRQLQTQANGDDSAVDKKATSDLLLILNDDNETYSIARANKHISGEFVIPSLHRGLPVTGILYDAFTGCDRLTDIIIPASINQIQGGYGCPVFDGCRRLKSIRVEEENQVYKSINGDLYLKANINEDFTSQIGDNLIRFSIGKTDSVFTLPLSAKVVLPHAFKGADNIKEIRLNKDFAVVCGGSFFDIDNIEAVRVDSQNRNFYSDDGNLFGIFKFGRFLALLRKERCFMLYAKGKTNESYAIPRNVAAIAYGAFTDCYNLKSLTIPKSVKRIELGAFVNCPSLTVYCEAESKPEDWGEGWDSGVKAVEWGVKRS